MAVLRFLCASNFFQAPRILQRRSIAQCFAQICGARDAAHYFRISRFRNVSNEKHVARRERFAEIARDVCFQFSGKACPEGSRRMPFPSLPLSIFPTLKTAKSLP